MSRKVTIKPSDHTFTCDEGETLLTAALRAGFILPYGCRNGACGACKGSGKAPLILPGYQNGNTIVAVAPDGSMLAAAGMDRKVTLWEIGTWRRRAHGGHTQSCCRSDRALSAFLALRVHTPYRGFHHRLQPAG